MGVLLPMEGCPRSPAVGVDTMIGKTGLFGPTTALKGGRPLCIPNFEVNKRREMARGSGQHVSALDKQLQWRNNESCTVPAAHLLPIKP